MTLTIRLDENLEAALRLRASSEGETLSEFVRKAVAERLEREGKRKSPYELGKHLFGKYSSGRSDLSVRSKEIYREKMRAKHSR